MPTKRKKGVRQNKERSVNWRPFREDDVRIIAEEVIYLLSIGYCDNNREAVLRGLTAAMQHAPETVWHRWAGVPLREVIKDLQVYEAT